MTKWSPVANTFIRPVNLEVGVEAARRAASMSLTKHLRTSRRLTGAVAIRAAVQKIASSDLNAQIVEIDRARIPNRSCGPFGRGA